ncbi:unnamed protein product [Cyprideis torosa]|uniref:sphingolipid 4-desaturase n=1 Tax=Cyprideis torosa TaxID=163714 RepID=A0A7R8WK37_9CRUS|nr:unnamed protein product [Cyprideis torosa]CAG0896479.1 unnamed protein product [Cyprideis torosa]
MGARESRTEFEWSYTAEPHATRRKEILAKHPEIKQLMSHDPMFKWMVLAVVLFQLACIPVVSSLPWIAVIIGGYVIGGTINHSLSLAIHEISHGEGFGVGRPFANQLLGAFTSLPLLVPMSGSFKKYHLEHHKYQGDEKKDTDIPTKLEAVLFRHTLGKMIWVLLQPFFYALRPTFVYPKPPTTFEIVNAAFAICFDALIVYFFGWKPVVYLFIGLLLATGMHPLAGHFISEHYMFKKGFETYSYYGPLNYLTWNVGYHNEHHDFPNIPGSKLPLLKKMAPEYYDNLPQHNSWVGVIYDFITDPNIGLYARMKRKSAGYTS